MSGERKKGDYPVVISCGILDREVEFLVNKNNWPVKLRILDSSLHVDLDKLEQSLCKVLSLKTNNQKLLIYGTCHPMMDRMLKEHNAIRTPVQNCVELLLGRTTFTEELTKGAFFLFEDWAIRWQSVSYKYFQDWALMKSVFQDGHNYIHCIRTPCSGNFEDKAREISERVGLPLVWRDYTLDKMEETLAASINSAFAEITNG